MKWLLSLLLVNAFAQTSGLLQNEDFKSLTDLHASVATITGNLSSGSPCIASPSSLANLAIGQFVYDLTTPANIPAGTTISALPGACPAGQIRMSANAAATVSNTITFGGQMSQLLNDSKLYVGSLGSQLSTLFTSNSILTNNNTATITNKTFDASLNTLSNVSPSMMTSGAATFGQ